MSKIPALYQHLQSIDDPSVDQAMAAALPTAEPATLPLIALMLLQRRQPSGLIALVLHYHRLPSDIQATIIKHAGDMYRPLREASTRTDSRGPANAIRIVRQSAAMKLTYLVADSLRHGSADLRDEAVDCLLDLALRVAPEPQAQGPVTSDYDAVSARYLQNTIEQVIERYRHHEQSGLLLVMATLLPRPMAKATAALSDWRNPAVEATRRLLVAATEPVVRRAAFAFMLIEPLTDAAINCLRRCDAQGTIGDVLRCAHLLRISSLRTAMRRLSDLDMSWLNDEQLEQWPVYQSRGLADWLATLPLPPLEKLEALGRLRHLGDPMSRLSALRSLIELASGEDQSYAQANDMISQFCFDSQPAIATIAIRHLIRAHWAGLAKLLLQLVNSQHPRVARLASQKLAPVGFKRFWDAWPRLEQDQQLAAGRALIKLDPTFHSQLADRLAGEGRSDKLRAMAMIHTLNQAELFEQPLIALTQHADRMIVSAAIKALGTAPSEAAHEVVEQALGHSDERVRANAIEALQCMASARHVDKLLAMTKADANRPRANAIHALLDLRTADAMHALADMLEDERPEHRISALWLVETAGLIQLARAVAELSVTDPDKKVKQRADHLIREMIVAMSSPAAASAPRVSLSDAIDEAAAVTSQTELTP